MCYVVLYRALSASGSHHAIFRKTFGEVRQYLFDYTFKMVMDMAFPGLWDETSNPKTSGSINHSELTIELPNGSVIYFHGMDDVDKRKGAEYSTVYIDEADSVLDFNTVVTLSTRLSENRLKDNGNGQRLMPKLLFSTNPNVTKKHWLYRGFVELTDPITRIAHRKPELWREVFINPRDNPHNTAEYIEILENAPPLKRRVYLEGEWLPTAENAMFQTEWIADNRAPIRRPHYCDDLARIIVAIDPAASSKENSDETGIIVAGIDHDGHLHILEDCSGRFTPDAWAKRAIEAFHEWSADAIIAERNNGGDMVEDTLRMREPNISVKTVWASRGKVTRAEPVANLYERGRVHHCGEFRELEEQIESFTIDWDRKNGSPDRLDAMVWALSELAVTEQKSRTGRAVSIPGFYG